MLRREQKIRNIILFTMFSILFIGVGYAVISSSLNINGSLQLNKITWDVHFENFQEAIDNSVKATSHIISEDGTTLTYNVKLNKPGDKYSFTIDVLNMGTIDAMIKSLGDNGLTEQQKKYLDYSLTYIDGTVPKVKDALPIGYCKTLVVTVASKLNIENSQLSSQDETLTLKLNPTYAQDDGTSVVHNEKLYDVIRVKAVADNIKSSHVQSESGMDFNQISSSTNGEGIYLRSGTENTDYPIYYFRGNVNNNNVRFDDYCWKIVRTTDTGGIKMIYNGTPTDGECNNIGDAALLPEKQKFNSTLNSPAYVGYMYGTPSTSNFNDASVQSAMFSNQENSTIKNYIENDWYENNMKDSTSKIEDTIYCNDRTVFSSTSTSIRFGAYNRVYTTHMPTLDCQRNDDKFTVSKEIGNGKLKYPVGLLTADEVMLAGATPKENTTYYLYTNTYYWLLSAYWFDSGNAGVFNLRSPGTLNNGDYVVNPYGVRPVISLKNNNILKTGSGTADNPYIIS